MTVDTQSTDKSVAQQLTATTYDLLSYFFVKKYLLVGASDVIWTGASWFSGSVDPVSERCMYVTPIRLDLL